MKHLKIFEYYQENDNGWEDFLTWVKSLGVEGDEQDLKNTFDDLSKDSSLGNDEKGTILASKLGRWGLHLNDKVAVMQKVSDMGL